LKLIVPPNDQTNFAIADWAGKKLGIAFYPPYYAIGVAPSDTAPMCGAVVFNDYNGHQIELTIYGPGILRPSIVRQLAHYAFVQLGCVRVTVRTKQSNTRVRKLIARRFKFECIAPRYFGTENAIVHRMLVEDCPWLERKNENRIAA
jgi:hypothetical protein